MATNDEEKPTLSEQYIHIAEKSIQKSETSLRDGYPALADRQIQMALVWATLAVATK